MSFAITRYVTMLSASTDERTMEKKQTTKKQHYISQGLLRLFSNDGKHIYECMIPQHRVYRARISDAMEENYTYEHSELISISVKPDSVSLHIQYHLSCWPKTLFSVSGYTLRGGSSLPRKSSRAASRSLGGYIFQSTLFCAAVVNKNPPPIHSVRLPPSQTC